MNWELRDIIISCRLTNLCHVAKINPHCMYANTECDNNHKFSIIPYNKPAFLVLSDKKIRCYEKNETLHDV